MKTVVVLVRPRIAGNIGASARVAMNFGVEELRLVAPEVDPHSAEATRPAVDARGIVFDAGCHESLESAVSDCHLVIATTSHRGRRSRPHLLPEEMSRLLEERPREEKLALVFGPESGGLTSVELDAAHQLLHIPTADAFPVLNLAQAVAITLASLRRPRAASEEPVPSRPTTAEFEAGFLHLRRALEQIGFFSAAGHDPIEADLRRMLRDAVTDRRDLAIWRGIARRIERPRRKLP